MALFLVLGLLAAGFFIYRAMTRKPVAAPCQGEESISLSWTNSDPKAPRDLGETPMPIDPLKTPHIKLATFLHRGNQTYGDKSATEYRHVHPALERALRAQGANGFFHGPIVPVGPDKVQVTTTAVAAHPGRITARVRDRFFPNNRTIQIVHVAPDGAAAKAGLAVNDLVIAANDQAMEDDASGFLDFSNDVPDDGKLFLRVIRADVEKTLTLHRQGPRKFGFWAIAAPIVEVAP